MSELSSTDVRAVRALISSPAWARVKQQLLNDFKFSPSKNDADLIRNAVGFSAWHDCVERFESYATPEKRLRAEKEEELEYDNSQQKPE